MLMKKSSVIIHQPPRVATFSNELFIVNTLRYPIIGVVRPIFE